jgi:hypothetical protein
MTLDVESGSVVSGSVVTPWTAVIGSVPCHATWTWGLVVVEGLTRYTFRRVVEGTGRTAPDKDSEPIGNHDQAAKAAAIVPDGTSDQILRVFQRPRLKTSAQRTAKVEKATATAMKAPSGPSPAT